MTPSLSSPSLRRSVDWSLIMGGQAPVPKARASAPPGELASLLSAFDTLLTADDTDSIVRRAIEVAKSHVGLDRAGIFLVDKTAEHMLGTWGRDLNGELVDEHHVMFGLDTTVVDIFRRAETASQPFTILDDCPIVVQRHDATEVAGRGWLACTPIRSPRARIGMLYNDAGLSGAPVDEAKQARAALLCSVLGSVIELAQALPRPPVTDPPSARHPAVRNAVDLLGKNPTLTGKELATSVGISLSRFVRIFKTELGVSLVEYRNRLRVARIQALIDSGQHNLYDAARSAGFGSYAQFHRVFRAAYGIAPRDYLRSR